MRLLTTLLWALLLGALGFVVVEIGGRTTGAITAMTSSLIVDLSVHALATLALTLLFHRPFARGRTWTWPLAVLGFVAAFAPVAGALAAAAELTLAGAWGSGAAVRSAFVQTPINLAYALAIDLPTWSLPAGIFVAGLLALRIRRVESQRGQIRFGRQWR